MEFSRSAGILLHPTSLPSKYGIGELGKDSFKFIDFLVDAGQTLWQIFPLGPTGYGDSPYQSFSAFAGNPLLISLDKFVEEGLLTDDDLANTPNFNPTEIDFGNLIIYKTELLKKAFENGKVRVKNNPLYQKFISDNSYWLDDYSLFMAGKEYHSGKHWNQWDSTLAFREESKMDEWKSKLENEIAYHKFIQFYFFKHWKAVKDYASEKGISIIGDMPIFIAYDSADLWANKHLFTVDKDGKLESVAGVPPDYFSVTGQLWGNPLYRWDEMQKNNFAWWKLRFKKLFELVDIVRVDHFRGFEAFWKIPGDAKTAVDGEWIKAPGEAFFTEIEKEFVKLPIIAEDLGVITDGVKALRDKFNFPGMKILQFAFGKDGDKNFLPHNYPKNCIVHTGSHDNDTTRGFFEKAKEEDNETFTWTQNYLNHYDENIVYPLIKEAYKSVANTVVIPLQDILNLGSEARMNFPGTLGGNWVWRFTWNQLNSELSSTYKNLVEMYERAGK